LPHRLVHAPYAACTAAFYGSRTFRRLQHLLRCAFAWVLPPRAYTHTARCHWFCLVGLTPFLPHRRCTAAALPAGSRAAPHIAFTPLDTPRWFALLVLFCLRRVVLRAFCARAACIPALNTRRAFIHGSCNTCYRVYTHHVTPRGSLAWFCRPRCFLLYGSRTSPVCRAACLHRQVRSHCRAVLRMRFAAAAVPRAALAFLAPACLRTALLCCLLVYAAAQAQRAYAVSRYTAPRHAFFFLLTTILPALAAWFAHALGCIRARGYFDFRACRVWRLHIYFCCVYARSDTLPLRAVSFSPPITWFCRATSRACAYAQPAHAVTPSCCIPRFFSGCAVHTASRLPHHAATLVLRRLRALRVTPACCRALPFSPCHLAFRHALLCGWLPLPWFCHLHHARAYLWTRAAVLLPRRIAACARSRACRRTTPPTFSTRFFHALPIRIRAALRLYRVAVYTFAYACRSSFRLHAYHLLTPLPAATRFFCLCAAAHSRASIRWFTSSPTLSLLHNTARYLWFTAITAFAGALPPRRA